LREPPGILIENTKHFEKSDTVRSAAHVLSSTYISALEALVNVSQSAYRKRFFKQCKYQWTALSISLQLLKRKSDKVIFREESNYWIVTR
jgi:hypothetical protein